MNGRPSAPILADMRLARPPIGVAARVFGALAVWGIALALPSAGQARPGDLDRTFSGDGRVTTQFPGSRTDLANAVAVQQDGRIVAAGDSNYGAVSRYLRGGSLDPSFGGGDGLVRPPQLGRISDVAIDRHDRIVVTGTSTNVNGLNEMRVARFLASGELDDSFGVDGISRIRLGGDADAAGLGQDLELERSGGIIVAGSRAPTNAANSDFAVVKLTPNGALDQSFANGGVKLIHRRGNDISGGVDIDRRGRITLGGTSNDRASFARLKRSGRLDRSFSGDGRTILKRLSDYDIVSSIVVKRGGSIVAAGTTSNDANPPQIDMFLARLRPDGSLKRSFGHRGRRVIDLNRLDRASDLALQAGGKIVVAGTSDYRFALLRLTRDGRLDSTFSGNGKTFTRFNRDDCVALGLTLQPNGRIVVAGYAITNFEEDWNKFALARYKNDGLPAGR